MNPNTLALVNSLRKKVSQLEQRQRESLSERKAVLEQEVQAYTEQLAQQAQANRLLEQMIARIRHSLEIDDILNQTAKEVKEFLDVEQVLIYRRISSQQFDVVAAAVSSQTTPSDRDIQQKILEVEQERATLGTSLEVVGDQHRAELIVPIEQKSQFWGFIYAYQEQRSRRWSFLEIESLERLAAQIAIALQQAQLYQSSRQAETALVELNQELEQRVKERTAELQYQLQERIQAENQLKTTNEQLQAVIDAVPGFISWIDSDLNYLGVNQRLASSLNLKPKDFVGQHIGFINNPQEFNHFIEDFFENKEQKVAQKTIKINVQGTAHYYLLVAQKYNQGQAAVSVGIDITENKHLEQESHVTFSRLNTLITNLKVGILLKDKRRNVLFVNQAFCDLFDIIAPPFELIGKSHSDFKEYYYPVFQDQEVIEYRNEEILNDQKLVTNEEWTLNNNTTIERDYIPIIIDNCQDGALWVYQDITDRKNYQIELENSLQQKEMLLKEIHHRVKNNLLVVSNLLEFQTDYTDDPQVLSVLEESQSRIQSMALIHEKLYRSTGLDKIDFGEYLEALLDNLFESYNVAETGINLETNIESIFLNIETANPCGLIVNELVSNAFKHAFPNERKGTIWISLYYENDEQINLVVQDNGVGFPQDLDLHQLDSLGLDLVQTLTQQIKGNLSIQQNQGTCFTLTFSERKYHKRYSAK